MSGVLAAKQALAGCILEAELARRAGHVGVARLWELQADEARRDLRRAMGCPEIGKHDQKELRIG